LLISDGSIFSEVGYNEVQVEGSLQRFVEDGKFPKDSQQVGTTWRFVNVDGGPDRRFNNNRQIPVMLYGEVDISTASGMRWVLQVSRSEAAGRLAADLTALRGAADPGEFPTTSSPVSEASIANPPPSADTDELFTRLVDLENSGDEVARSILELEPGFWTATLGPLVKLQEQLRGTPGATIDPASLPLFIDTLTTKIIRRVEETARSAASSEMQLVPDWDIYRDVAEEYLRTALVIRDEVGRLAELDRPAVLADLEASVTAGMGAYRSLVVRLKWIDPAFEPVGSRWL